VRRVKSADKKRGKSVKPLEETICNPSLETLQDESAQYREIGKRHATLFYYLHKVHAVEDFDRETEIAIVKEIRKLEVERWLALFFDIRCPRKVDAALKRSAEATFKDDVRVPIQTMLSRLRSAAKLAEAGEAFFRRYQDAMALALKTVVDADRNRVLFDRIFDSLNAEADIESVLHPDTVWTIEKLSACIEGTTHRLITANLRHVAAIARRYDFGLLPFADLVQEGNIGLIDAVKRFDHTRGVRLKTFASGFIKHSMRKALAHKGRTVRIPANVIDDHYRIRQTHERFWTQHGRAPSQDELAVELGIGRDELARIVSHPPLNVVSADGQMSNQEGRTFLETMIDETGRDPHESILLGRWLREMSRVLGVLTQFERHIIEWRFGLDGNEELSFRQIGRQCNLSGERIRQLQNIALDKMRLAFCPEIVHYS
jgi:RNA polymerase sigma factor (sigma-70 family)